MSDNVIEVSVRPASAFPQRAPEVPPAVAAAAAAAAAETAKAAEAAKAAEQAKGDEAAKAAAEAKAAQEAAAAAGTVLKPGDPGYVEPKPASFEQQKPPEKQDAPDGAVIVEYAPTGDAGLDLALQFVGELGFGPERADMKAAMAGDFSLLSKSLKELGPVAKGYERSIKVAEESYKRIIDGRKAKDDAVMSAITSAAGGVEQWNAVHEWVAAEADDQQKADITAAFKAGAFSAGAMARQLTEMYKASGKSTLAPKSAVKATAGVVADVTGGAMTAQQYKEEIRRLETKYGYRLQDTDEYRNAVARRRLSLKQGA
jgi:hypothetical protein